MQSGKLSRRTLDKLKRNEAAHANSMENFAFFAAASMLFPDLLLFEVKLTIPVLLAVQAGLPSETINKIGASFTLCRVVFGLAYIYIESEGLSFLRSIAYWGGNISCISAIVMAGRKLQ